MENKFKGIDAETYPEVASKLSQVVKSEAEKLLGTELSGDQMEVLNLSLSKKFGGNLKKIKAEVLELCGVISAGGSR